MQEPLGSDTSLDPGSLLKPMGKAKPEPQCYCPALWKNEIGGMHQAVGVLTPEHAQESGGGPSHQRPHHQGHEARWQPGPFRTEQQHQNTTKAEPGQPEGPERCAEQKGEVTPLTVKPTLVVEGQADQDAAGQKTDEIGDEHGDECSVGKLFGKYLGSADIAMHEIRTFHEKFRRCDDQRTIKIKPLGPYKLPAR